MSDDINATCTQCDCMVRQARSVIMNVQLGASPHSVTHSMGASVGCNYGCNYGCSYTPKLHPYIWGVIMGVILGVITRHNYTRIYDM